MTDIKKFFRKPYVIYNFLNGTLFKYTISHTHQRLILPFNLCTQMDTKNSLGII